jgi:hypothetical protein
MRPVGVQAEARPSPEPAGEMKRRDVHLPGQLVEGHPLRVAGRERRLRRVDGIASNRPAVGCRPVRLERRRDDSRDDAGQLLLDQERSGSGEQAA